LTRSNCEDQIKRY